MRGPAGLNPTGNCDRKTKIRGTEAHANPAPSNALFLALRRKGQTLTK